MNNNNKKISFLKAVMLFAAIGIFVGCVSIELQARREMFIEGATSGSSPVVATASAASDDLGATVTSSVGLGASFDAPGLPVRLVIPAIGVDANIQQVGMSWSGVNIGVPTNFTDVGWFKYGSLPGAPGTAIIDGHLDGKYVPKGVFFNLQNLKPGDEVDVTGASGTAMQFQVVAVKLYDYAASTTDIFGGSATSSRLVLITCAGSWLPTEKLYDQRVVVFAQLATAH